MDILFLAAAGRARKELLLDLTPLEWVSPMGIVAILATALASAERNLTVDILMPTGVAPFLEHIGFIAELRRRNWSAPPAQGTPSGFNPCLPVMALERDSEVDTMQELLIDRLSMSFAAPNVVAEIGTVAAELTANAREHGTPTSGKSSCYAVAQGYSGASSGRSGVTVAVADFGGGFAASLRARYGKMLDEHAMERAFDERVSATGLPDRGLGLAHVLEAVDRHQGASLEILSYRGRLVRRERRFERSSLPVKIAGTFATAHFPHAVYNPVQLKAQEE